MRAYRFVPQAPSPKFNPDGLPIGFAKAVVPEGRWKGEWVSPTCAACHELELEYKGTTIKISGGNNKNADFYGFIQGLDDALGAWCPTTGSWRDEILSQTISRTQNTPPPMSFDEKLTGRPVKSPRPFPGMDGLSSTKFRSVL
jgi:hypothetical protein